MAFQSEEYNRLGCELLCSVQMGFVEVLKKSDCESVFVQNWMWLFWSRLE